MGYCRFLKRGIDVTILESLLCVLVRWTICRVVVWFSDELEPRLKSGKYLSRFELFLYTPGLAFILFGIVILGTTRDLRLEVCALIDEWEATDERE